MFYTYRQNNSGGSFDIDAEKGLAHFVIIEADFKEEANEKAIGIGIYFDGVEEGLDCECCGDRWGSHPDENKTPMIYGRDAFVSTSNYYNKVAIHYKDGSLKLINF